MRVLRSFPVRALAAIAPALLGWVISDALKRHAYVMAAILAVGALGTLARELIAVDDAHAWFRSTLDDVFGPSSPGGTET